MHRCKPFHQDSSHVIFAAKKYSFPGNEDILKNHQGFPSHQSKPGIAGVHPFLELSFLVGLAAKDQNDARCIDGYSTSQSIVSLFLPHRLGRHDQDLMGVDRPCLMSLGSPDDDAIGSPLDDMSKEVRVGLFVRRKGAIPLRIGHSSHHHDIALLDVDQVFLESLKVIRLIFLIGVIGRHVNCIQGIETDTSLEAGTRLVGDEAQHLDFFDQVIDALVDVGKPVDLLSGQMGGGCHQVLVLGPQGKFVGERGGIDVGTQRRDARSHLPLVSRCSKPHDEAL